MNKSSYEVQLTEMNTKLLTTAKLRQDDLFFPSSILNNNVITIWVDKCFP